MTGVVFFVALLSGLTQTIRFIIAFIIREDALNEETCHEGGAQKGR